MGEKLIPINTMKINYNNVFTFQITVKINYNNVFRFQNTVFYKTFFINQFTFQFHSSFVRFYIYILIIHFKLSGTMLDVTPWDKRQKVKGFKFCFERFHPTNFQGVLNPTPSTLLKSMGDPKIVFQASAAKLTNSKTYNGRVMKISTTVPMRPKHYCKSR